MARLFDADTEYVSFGTGHGNDSIPLTCYGDGSFDLSDPEKWEVIKAV